VEREAAGDADADRDKDEDGIADEEEPLKGRIRLST
jgi:hypothetical protein